MNFENERWVKLYTRDTASWVALSWPARNLLIQLLRKVDRAGSIELGRAGTRALAGLLSASDHRAEVEASLRELVEDGAVVLSDDGARLTLPRFTEAQESRMSASARAKLARDKKKAGLGVTKRDGSVTPCDGDEAQHSVTLRDASVTKRDGDVAESDTDVENTSAEPMSQNVTVASRGVTVATRKPRIPCRGVAEQNRTEQKRREGGERARDAHAPAPARAHAREETPPAPSLSGVHEELEEALLGGVDRTPGRWDESNGKPWQRAALLAELEERGFGPREANELGRYLASPGAASAEKTQVFSYDWFVFGKPSAPEFKRLDGVLRRARTWAAERAAVGPQSGATKAKSQEPDDATKRARAKAIADALRGKRPATAPSTDSRVATIGEAIDEVLGGAR